MPYDRPPNDLRCSDADREAAAERIRVAALEGRLDAMELDERLTAVYDARWCSELSRLCADVTPPAPAPAAPAPPTFVRSAPTNGLAIASLLCGLLWMGWIGSLLAIVFGHVALAQIDRSEGRQSGRGLAIGGLFFGYGGALLFALMVLAFAL